MKTNYQNTGLLDMIFEQRNKSYGAYVLRSDYGKSITRAFLITLTAIVALCIGKFLSDKLNREQKEGSGTIVTISPVPPIHLEEELQIKVKQQKPPQAQALNSIHDPEMRVVSDNRVNTDSIPTVAQMREIDPGLSTNINGNSTGIENGTGNQPYVQPVPEPEIAETEPTRIPEEMPVFPGGEVALLKFLRDHTEFPDIERELGIGGKVLSEFTVNEDGRVSDVKIIKSPSQGFNKEVIRVTKLLPNFSPGKQHGRPVKVSYVLPFSFNAE